MRHILTAALLVLLGTVALGSGSVSAARDGPVPFSAEYRVLYKGALAGKASISLSEADGLWQTRIVTEAKGLFWFLSKYINSTEISQFRAAEDGSIEPVSYRLDRPGQKKGRRLLRIDFLDDTVEVARDTGDPTLHPMPETGAWDRLSMLFSVPATVGERSEGDVILDIVSRHGPARKRLELLGRVTVATPAGEFNTLHMRYNTGKRTAEYWIATTDGGIPVKMLYREDGDDAGTLELTELSR